VPRFGNWGISCVQRLPSGGLVVCRVIVRSAKNTGSFCCACAGRSTYGEGLALVKQRQLLKVPVSSMRRCVHGRFQPCASLATSGALGSVLSAIELMQRHAP
jgi:hypothetical protein